MGSEDADPIGDRLKVSTRSSSSKRSAGKVPRKINKAVREKLKRDHLNELFLDLGKTLDLDQANNGKASTLRETIRLLRELLTQMDGLKKENATLSSESNYVTMEKNELVEEISALDVHIKSLQTEIDERANCSNVDVSKPRNDATTRIQEDHVSFPLVGELASVVSPMFVFPNPFPEVDVPKVPSSVSKPCPRYPSASDSWTSEILAKQRNVSES